MLIDMGDFVFVGKIEVYFFWALFKQEDLFGFKYIFEVACGLQVFFF